MPFYLAILLNFQGAFLSIGVWEVLVDNISKPAAASPPAAGALSFEPRIATVELQ